MYRVKRAGATPLLSLFLKHTIPPNTYLYNPREHFRFYFAGAAKAVGPILVTLDSEGFAPSLSNEFLPYRADSVI